MTSRGRGARQHMIETMRKLPPDVDKIIVRKCQFIEDDKFGSDLADYNAMFCNKPCVPGKSYCKKHVKMCYYSVEKK